MAVLRARAITTERVVSVGRHEYRISLEAFGFGFGFGLGLGLGIRGVDVGVTRQ
jgi:hypothetical protein